MTDIYRYPAPISQTIAIGLLHDAVLKGPGQYTYSSSREVPQSVYSDLKEYIKRNTDIDDVKVSNVYGYLQEYWKNVVLELGSRFMNGNCQITIRDTAYEVTLNMNKEEVVLVVKEAG